MKKILCILTTMACAATTLLAEPTRIAIHPKSQKQVFDGMGCGTIFYSGHITSLAKRNKHKLQQQFYDELFKDVRTEYLHLMIRPAFEPKNDNDDPYTLNFTEKAFEKNRAALEVSKAARKRRPNIKLFATLYTPPAWMKTNGKPDGGGKERGTLKPGLTEELGEYMWAYLVHMQRNGEPVHYLSICNEPDWEHDQPSYFLTPDQHAVLLRDLMVYFDRMVAKHPDIKMPKIAAPNLLSTVGTAKRYWPAMQKLGVDKRVDVVASHDYDRRGHRWATLRELAGDRPLWCSEWCWNGKDTSPDLIKAASEFWLVMTEAFNDGANVWMAYDWAYPPREGGEALTHVEWGQSYHKTKIYYAFKQWSNPLTPGMRIVDSKVTGPSASGISSPGVKASAFVSPDGAKLVIHTVNLQDKAANIALDIQDAGFKNAKFRITRTSEADAHRVLPDTTYPDDGFSETLKPREMVTYQLVRIR